MTIKYTVDDIALSRDPLAINPPKFVSESDHEKEISRLKLALGMSKATSERMREGLKEIIEECQEPFDDSDIDIDDLLIELIQSIAQQALKNTELLDE